jgi:hypothetical protein
MFTKMPIKGRDGSSLSASETLQIFGTLETVENTSKAA